MFFHSLAGAMRTAVPCLIAAALAAPFATVAAEVSLQEAVQRAVQSAPLLEARRAAVESARQESQRAGALPDPMLSVGIDNLPVTGADAFDTRMDGMTMKKIGLRQDIPARAKRDAQRALAGRQVDEAQAQSQAEALAVRRAAAEAWIDLWAAQRELAALQASGEEAALAARLGKARVAGGAGTGGDALAAAAAVLELDNRVEAAPASEQAAQAALARWLGGGAVHAGIGMPDFDSLPIAAERLLAAVERVGPLLPANAQVESAAAAIDAARADKRPDWSVGASYGQRSGTRSDMLMLEVGIGLPLFVRNRQDRGIAAREAEYRAALASREDLRRQETARIRADVARWEALKRQAARYGSGLLPLSRDRSAAALAAYRAGGELQPWLDARRDELDTQVAYARSLGELGRAWAALAFLLLPETQP
ncbi:TolC family protein [Pseudoxanthomonas wuyuanensis]|uniref:TolC family protein n=1 Tax=Pseudoxanthomonas wuyuanensis TaxID=1073196 RepID=UPI001EE4E73B|nr:TolC family protein [Pseudoxanthomonas wuyuanensis]